MLHIAVVDSSAASRQQLCTRFQEYVRLQFEEFPLLPTYSIQPLSPNELKFHGTPDICILGPEMLRSDLLEVARVRELFPHISILVSLTPEFNSLGMVEQLARLGADDVLVDTIPADEFVRKLVLLSRRAPVRGNGNLILLDGAKGGVGITSLTAGLGEALVDLGRTVTLVDGDFESQDLSRFLQAKPFVNENLRFILDEQRPITKEYVEHCAIPVWGDAPGMRIVPPPPEAEDLWAPTPRQGRILASFFETLEQTCDDVIVDIGSFRGVFRDLLYRISDRIICVVNNDPASLFASIDRIEKIRRSAGPDACISLIENGSFSAGVSNELLRQEFARAARVESTQWLTNAIPFCRKGSCWPASGGTLFSSATTRVANSLKRTAQALVSPSSASRHQAEAKVSTMRSFISRFISVAPKQLESTTPHRGVRPASVETHSVKLPLLTGGRRSEDSIARLSSTPSAEAGEEVARVSREAVKSAESAGDAEGRDDIGTDEIVSRVKIAS